MYTPEHNTRVSGSALLPFAVFIVIYLGAGLIQQARGVQMAFYQFPSVTAMFFAVITAFAMTREPFNKSVHIFSRGASKEDVITMLLIYVLAGAFSAVSGATALVNAYYGTGEVTSLDFIPYVWYCWLLLLFGLLSILFPFVDGVIRKNPWNWE